MPNLHTHYFRALLEAHTLMSQAPNGLPPEYGIRTCEIVDPMIRGWGLQRPGDRLLRWEVCEISTGGSDDMAAWTFELQYRENRKRRRTMDGPALLAFCEAEGMVIKPWRPGWTVEQLRASWRKLQCWKEGQLLLDPDDEELQPLRKKAEWAALGMTTREEKTHPWCSVWLRFPDVAIREHCERAHELLIPQAMERITREGLQPVFHLNPAPGGQADLIVTFFFQQPGPPVTGRRGSSREPDTPRPRRDQYRDCRSAHRAHRDSHAGMTTEGTIELSREVQRMFRVRSCLMGISSMRPVPVPMPGDHLIMCNDETRLLSLEEQIGLLKSAPISRLDKALPWKGQETGEESVQRDWDEFVLKRHLVEELVALRMQLTGGADRLNRGTSQTHMRYGLGGIDPGRRGRRMWTVQPGVVCESNDQMKVQRPLRASEVAEHLIRGGSWHLTRCDARNSPALEVDVDVYDEANDRELVSPYLLTHLLNRQGIAIFKAHGIHPEFRTTGRGLVVSIFFAKYHSNRLVHRLVELLPYLFHDRTGLVEVRHDGKLHVRKEVDKKTQTIIFDETNLDHLIRQPGSWHPDAWCRCRTVDVQEEQVRFMTLEEMVACSRSLLQGDLRSHLSGSILNGLARDLGAELPTRVTVEDPLGTNTTPLFGGSFEPVPDDRLREERKSLTEKLAASLRFHYSTNGQDLNGALEQVRIEARAAYDGSSSDMKLRQVENALEYLKGTFDGSKVQAKNQAQMRTLARPSLARKRTAILHLVRRALEHRPPRGPYNASRLGFLVAHLVHHHLVEGGAWQVDHPDTYPLIRRSQRYLESHYQRDLDSVHDHKAMGRELKRLGEAGIIAAPAYGRVVFKRDALLEAMDAPVRKQIKTAVESYSWWGTNRLSVQDVLALP